MGIKIKLTINTILKMIRFPSIRSKFIIIFIVLGFIPLLVVGYFSYISASTALIHQTRNQLGNLADKTAQQIDTFFERVEKDINLLSDFPFIQLSFLQHEFGQRLDTARRLVEEYEKKHPYYKRVHLVDLNGQSILTVPESTGVVVEFFHTFDWFKPALEKDIYLSDIVVNTPFSESYVVIAKKVYDFEERTKPVGLLVFEIRLGSFTNFVSSLKIGSQGYSFLLDEKGYLVYHPDPNLFWQNTLIQQGDHRLSQLFAQMRSGQKGFGEYEFKGKTKFMVFTSCRIKPWSVGITLQKEEFMADILKYRKSILTFSGVIVVLIILVSIYFIRSLTQPIHQLISGAQAIGGGDLEQAIEVESSDELKELATEFNAMASRLKESMHEIVELKTFSDDIFRSVSNGILTVDQNGVITSMNKQAEIILACSEKECLETDKIGPGMQKCLALLKTTLGTKEKIVHEVVDYIDDHEEPVFIEINTSLLNNSNGDVIGSIADIRDITLRKQMEDLMVRVDKLASLGEMSAGIAHEIRNPLAGMKTSIQVLAAQLKASSQVLLMNGVLAEIDRLNSIVTDLLKFSGSSPSYPGSVNVKNLIQKSLDLLMEKSKRGNIDIHQQYDADNDTAFIDREQIQQVFINLLLNAFNAMPDGGTLTISTRLLSGKDVTKEKISRSLDINTSVRHLYLMVTFKDTGIGVKERHRSKIFNPFFTTDPNGTGLGLSIAHKLLEKNNAHIFIDSKEGKGCKVTLLLPAELKENTKTL